MISEPAHERLGSFFDVGRFCKSSGRFTKSLYMGQDLYEVLQTPATAVLQSYHALKMDISRITALAGWLRGGNDGRTADANP